MSMLIGLILGWALTAEATIAGVADVEGVLSFDEHATHPIYLLAYDVPAGMTVVGVRVYNNDPATPPLHVLVAPSNALGMPALDQAVTLTESVAGEGSNWLQYATVSTSGIGSGRTWVGAEYQLGNPNRDVSAGGGAGIGYRRMPPETESACLVSADGGASFDGLERGLQLAIEVQEAPQAAYSTASSWAPVGAASAAAARTALLGAAPNPSHSGSAIAYTLASNERVSLTIYDARGRKVRTLVNEVLTAGPHSAAWDGRDDADHAVAAGVYHVRLLATGASDIQRLLLLR
jgi:hypothetical protein